MGDSTAWLVCVVSSLQGGVSILKDRPTDRPAVTFPNPTNSKPTALLV